MFDFAIIAEREIITNVKNGKKMTEKQCVELFSAFVLPDIGEREIEKRIVSAKDPLEAYIDALAERAKTIELDEPIYNRNYQIIGTRKKYPLKERLDDIIEKVSAYINDGWNIRLVY